MEDYIFNFSVGIAHGGLNASPGSLKIGVRRIVSGILFRKDYEQDAVPTNDRQAGECTAV
jgi:hypothetical protein